jgi:HK97 family phage portal protein
MSWLGRVLPFARKNSGGSSLDILRELMGATRTKSGKIVTHKTAVEVSTVFACARAYGHGLAQVPFRIYRDQGRSKLPATDHPLYRLLSLRPNPLQTSFEFFEMLAFHVVLAGNAHCYKNVVGGRVVELLPFEPGTIQEKRGDDWSIHYEATLAGKVTRFSADQIWHIKGAGWTPWVGLDAVKLARDAIGLAVATEETHASLHKNGIRSTGTYSVEGTLSGEQYKQLEAYIKKWQGSENAGTPLIMDRAAKWLSDTMSGVDSQHLETRRYQVEEICRHMGVMPVMVCHADKTATYASVEQMLLAHVVHTLAPFYRRFEQSISVHVLGEKDVAAGYYPKFITQGLLRGALKDTAEYLNKLVSIGIMTRNEAREVLELNPIEGLDEPLSPLNLGGANSDAPSEPAPGV